MTQQAIAQLSTSASRLALRTATNTELDKIDDNFDELYPAIALLAPKLRTQTVAGSSRELSLAELTGTVLTNNLQTVSENADLTIAAPVVAGMEWDMVIAVTLNGGVRWKLTLPLGASFLFNGTMGTNGGAATFTAPARGSVARCKAITIATGVVVVIESSATTLAVT